MKAGFSNDAHFLSPPPLLLESNFISLSLLFSVVADMTLPSALNTAFALSHVLIFRNINRQKNIPANITSRPDFAGKDPLPRECYEFIFRVTNCEKKLPPETKLFSNRIICYIRMGRSNCTKMTKRQLVILLKKLYYQSTDTSLCQTNFLYSIDQLQRAFLFDIEEVVVFYGFQYRFDSIDKQISPGLIRSHLSNSRESPPAEREASASPLKGAWATLSR